ncbi:MAG: C-GCAxxG-C-C family protein [Chloroflexota bacterium]
MLQALQESLGLESELVFKAASYMSGGVAGTGNLCGALTGGIMFLGMKYGRANPRYGAVRESSGPALKLVKWFEREYGTTICRELVGVTNMLDREERAKFHVSEAHKRCFRRSGEVAAKVFEIISNQGSRQVSFDEALDELEAEGLL